MKKGLREVVDADLSGYFDTIPHAQLMRSLARRISDGAMLELLKKWLQMPVEESNGRGGKRRSNLVPSHVSNGSFFTIIATDILGGSIGAGCGFVS